MEDVFEKLKKILESKVNKGETLYILPHDNADCDALVSSWLMSEILIRLGYQSEVLVFDGIPRESAKIIDNLFYGSFKYEVPQSENTKRKLILVDHHETSHSGEIVAIVDHHKTSKTFPSNLFYLNKRESSCALVIFDMLTNVYEDEVDTMMAEAAIVATLMDTVGFSSSKCIEGTEKRCEDLRKKYYVQRYYRWKKRASNFQTDLRVAPLNTLANNSKKYMYEEYKVGSSYIDVNENMSKAKLDEFLLACQSFREKEALDVMVFIVHYKRQYTAVYVINTKEMAKISFEGYKSRGNDIMPEIEKKLICMCRCRSDV